MKALVTGIDGFIGSHIVDFLLDKNIDVYGTTKRKDPKNVSHVKDRIKTIVLDITDKASVEKVVSEIKPDYVFHMAAQTYVMPSWGDIEYTFNANIFGTLYLLDAIRKAGISPVVAVACSSAEYGLTMNDEIPITETKEFRPSSPYAVSKVVTDMLSYLYARTYGMKIIRLRFFNTIGPRKTGSAVADWCQGIAEIEAGLKKELSVGNLEPILDLTDVRDSINAIWILMHKGKWGDVYNVCTGNGNKMIDVLDEIKSLSKSDIKIVIDKKKFRPEDDAIYIGDNSKIKELGWSQTISLKKTLEDTLNYWRSDVKSKH